METYGELTTEEQVALNSAIQELSIYVKKWKISSESISKHEALEISNTSPGRVFSVIRDWMTPAEGPISKMGFWLSPGFSPDCDDYYESSRDFDGPINSPHTEIRFGCSPCDTEGEVNGEVCEACDGEQELVLDLTWDENGDVTAG
jgi:hypothetical protein